MITTDSLRGREPQMPDGFEQLSANGLQCTECGATVQNAGNLTKRHREWHLNLERRLGDAKHGHG